MFDAIWWDDGMVAWWYVRWHGGMEAWWDDGMVAWLCWWDGDGGMMAWWRGGTYGGMMLWLCWWDGDGGAAWWYVRWHGGVVVRTVAW